MAPDGSTDLEQTLVARGRYLNGRVYADYKWRDETVEFDPEARWNGDGYYREYCCRVPRRMLERALITGDHGALTDWVERNSDKPIWLD